MKRGWREAELARRGALRGLALAVVIGAARYATLDVVPAKITARGSLAGTFALSAHAEALNELVTNPPGSRFQEAYRELLAESDYSKVLFADHDGTLEQPGDYRVDTSSNGWLLTILDGEFIARSIPVSSNGVPEFGSQK